MHTTQNKQIHRQVSQTQRMRFSFFFIVLCAVFGIFIVRFAEMQLFFGEKYRDQADANRFFTRYLPASRGIFTDRKGRALVRNAPMYKKPIDGQQKTLYPEFMEISQSEALDLLAKESTTVRIEQQRTYVYSEALSIILGYIGETTKEELQLHPEYHIGENVGKYGLEKVFQSLLAGTAGKEKYEVDAVGNIVRLVSVEQPKQGTDLQLTIDADLSAEAYRLLDGKKGAVVATNPQTGEVYALVSSPSFDPTQLQDALHNPNKPFLNRAISGLYPPGSTFKVVTAIAGLETGVLKDDTTVDDTGELVIGEFRFRNWYYTQYGRKEGMVDVVKALQRSNDIFFYKTAEWVGPEKLAEYAKLFGYGKQTGIVLSSEAAGIVPDPEWKQRTVGEQWYMGNTYHMGIGQGDVLTTPIQINQMTAAVANNGVWCAPRLTLQEKRECADVHIEEKTIEKVKEGMKKACQAGGTAYPFFDEKPVPVACKTGTAEFGVVDEQGKRKTHAVFTVMAPADKPTIVITVVVEATDDAQFLEGSRDAAPIAKSLLMQWFSNEQ